ncbi:putative zinc ribbon protein [Paenibacillus taihuensis]|uniref:Putative zinc ribbon protein n=1 Tax=Paenibacillus taihuensis TaxID=1156355 RepID=A0A3D9SB39_9BACL|nr:zinc ribbon domain-containing protein [Paenibacillus taihuensis]REE86432.1 putative zinc ribbon protein [Paenibacillus taihuensis]
MSVSYKNCQSCGMPIAKGDKNGTEAGGSKSLKYCVHCYVDGKFTMLDMTASQMQEFVKGKMVGMGFPKFLTGFFTRGIPKLERWKNN